MFVGLPQQPVHSSHGETLKQLTKCTGMFLLPLQHSVIYTNSNYCWLQVHCSCSYYIVSVLVFALSQLWFLFKKSVMCCFHNESDFNRISHSSVTGCCCYESFMTFVYPKMFSVNLTHFNWK